VAAGILAGHGSGLTGAAEYYDAAGPAGGAHPAGAPSRGAERKDEFMTVSVVGLSIDCADAAALARFWSEVLGRPVNAGADAERAAIDATDPASGPRLSFQRVPEPKTVKNRLHLDLRTDRFEAENDRLTGLGATAIRSFERPTIRWTTFADPEGNEFDLIAAPAPVGGD
jgi:predicted enzyme related to lactoylglutathione lyase